MSMIIRRLNWPITIITWGTAAGLVTAANLESPIRLLIVFGFVLICPGMAFVRMFHIREGLNQATLAIALSLAIDTIVAEIMVMTQWWSPTTGLIVIVAMSIIAAVL